MNWRVLTNSTLIVTAAVYAMLIVLATSAGLFGIWLLVLVILSLWRYGYAVLRAAAQGVRNIPPPSIESMNPVGSWTLLLHFALFPALIAAIAQIWPVGNDAVGSVLNIAFSLVVVGVFPASSAIMGCTSNIVVALNPAAIRSVIRTLGLDYVWLVAACAGLVGGAALIRTVLLPDFGLLAGLMATTVEVWTLLAVFALIGSSLHAHSDDFDLPRTPPSPEARETEDLRKEWRAELDLAYGFLRSGDLQKGYGVLRELIEKNNQSIELQYWLFDKLSGWADSQHSFRVAERLIDRLVEIGDSPAALQLFVHCRQVGGELAMSAQTSAALATYADSIGQRGIASELQVGAEVGSR
jgi:hypothetical protein